MTTATTIQQLAAEVRKEFRRATRPDGEEFWAVARFRKRDSNAEDWIYGLCHDAHGDMLPDDWRYAFIVEALDAISEHEHEDDARDSLEADIYTAELLRWVSSNINRISICDDAAKEYGADSAGIVDRLQMGQLQERREVFESVLSSLQNRLEALETEEP